MSNHSSASTPLQTPNPTRKSKRAQAKAKIDDQIDGSHSHPLELSLESSKMAASNSRTRSGTQEKEMEEGSEESQELSKNPQDSTRKGKARKSHSFRLGFRVDLSWCKSVKWNEFLTCVGKQNWEKLLDDYANEGLYENEMKEFFSTFENVNGMIIGVVQGKIVRFDQKVLSKWFEVPTEGYSKYEKGVYKLKIGNHSKESIVKFFGGKPTNNSIEQKNLSPFHKILFQLVWRFILPRPQKRSTACLMDLAVMFCLAKGLKINFPSLMISHITHCVKQKMVVGYGNLFTTIFRQSNITLHEPTFKLEPDSVLNANMLRRISLMIIKGKVMPLVEEEEPDRKLKRKFGEQEDDVHSPRKSQRVSSKEAPASPSATLAMAYTRVASDAAIASLHRKTDELTHQVAQLESQLTIIRGEILAKIRQSEEAIITKLDSIVARFTRRTP